MRVNVVGLCGAGKSSLVRRLRCAGCDAHEIAQEHSGVPDLWRRLRSPEALVFLDASLETIWRRRPGTLLTPVLYGDLQSRLAHARAHAGLVVATDDLTEEAVAGIVRAHLTCLLGKDIITRA